MKLFNILLTLAMVIMAVYCYVSTPNASRINPGDIFERKFPDEISK